LGYVCCHVWSFPHLFVRFLGFVQSCGDDKIGGNGEVMGFLKEKIPSSKCKKN
jgi:hypothetical protein